MLYRHNCKLFTQHLIAGKACYVIMLMAMLPGLFACSNKCSDIGGAIRLRFVDYDSASLEKVSITRYPVGDQFRHPIDSTEYYLSQSQSPIETYDAASGFVWWPYEGMVTLLYSNDYLVHVAATGQEFRFSEIAITDDKASCPWGSGQSTCICYDVVTSYNLNGTSVSTGMYSGHAASPSHHTVSLNR